MFAGFLAAVLRVVVEVVVVVLRGAVRLAVLRAVLRTSWAISSPASTTSAASFSLPLSTACATLARLGQAAGVQIEAPLLDPRFVAALARAGGARGWGNRVATVRAIAGVSLPEALFARLDKAGFNAAFFGLASRGFAETWSGRGVDATLVDPDALRRAWLEPEPDFRSALLLQLAWLHDHGQPDGVTAEQD